MRVIAKRALREFWKTHADAEQPLKAWYAEASKARWQSFQAIKQRYRHADVLPGDRVVFNIGGNKYRLVVAIRYDVGIVFIRFIGTHAEYDRIDATQI